MPDPNPFAGFVPQANPVKPTGFDSFVNPYSKEESRALFERTGAFEGDSQYDQGLVFGMNQAKNRAANQPWYDQLGNQSLKVIPGIALGLIENAGYIGELFDSSNDYSNAFTEYALKKRGTLESEFPVYRENPEAVFDLGDPGWWMQHGEGLVESIGEFLVTGAGIGGALGKGAEGLATLVKANAAVSQGFMGAAQLTTAAGLAYTEGAMSGNQIYKDVLAETGNKELAAESAAKTVRLNTTINTLLNITSVSAIFKATNGLSDAARTGLTRKSGEKLGDWVTRLTDLETNGVPAASLRKHLIGEAAQEGLEEEVNLFAEGEGRIKGGLQKATSSDPVQRFLQGIFTEEGALNAILGAVGGVAQTAGMAKIPYNKYTNEEGATSFISNETLSQIRDNEAAKRYITTLRDDITYIVDKQKQLQTAVDNNDENAIQKAKEDLFNVAALKSLREGKAENFTEDLQEIAHIDNVQVGEDGKTEAMRRGYANNTDDNEYKATAMKKISDVRSLTKDYENLQRMFDDKFVADQVFRSRMEIYSSQNVVDRLQQADMELLGEVSKMATNPLVLPLVEQSANVAGLSLAIDSAVGQKADKRIIDGLKASLMIQEKLLADAIEADPEMAKELNLNKGLVSQMLLTKTPMVLYQENLRTQKGLYARALEDREKTTKDILKQKDELVNVLKKKAETKQKVEEKVAEKKDKEEAKQQQAQVYKELVGKYLVQSNPNGGFDVIDNEASAIVDNKPTLNEAKASAQSFNKAKEKPEPVQEVQQDPIIVTKTPEQDLSYQGQTKTEEAETERGLEQDINKLNIDEVKSGKANKIAYRAVEENGEGPINPDYLILHSPTINVGTPITLRVANETKFFKEGMSNAQVPIGVYINDKLSGYLHQNIGSNKSGTLEELRDYIVAKGPVATTISDKDLGRANYTAKKRTTSEALPVIKAITVGIDNKLFAGVKQVYNHPLKNNPNRIETGRTYAIVGTPNGTDFAFPLDTKNVSQELVKSVMLAFRTFLNQGSLTPQENKMFDEIFEKYDVDIRTPAGFGKYFKTFFYNYNLSDPDNITDNNNDKKDKRWVQFTGNGIRYMKSGGALNVDGQLQAKEISVNTPDSMFEILLGDLEQHLSKMFYNVSLEDLQFNRAITLPSFYINKNQDIAYKEYIQPDYVTHVKSITETKLLGVPLGDGSYTYFISPKIYFNPSFSGSQAIENTGVPLDQRKEEPKPVLSAEEKPKKKLKSMAKRLPESKVDNNQITNDIADERINFCK